METVNKLTPEEAGLTLKVVHGPVGKVRDAWPCISYIVIVFHGEQEVWKGDYHLGVGHADIKKVGDPWRVVYPFNMDEKMLLATWKKKPYAKFIDRDLHARTAAKLASAQKVKPELNDVVHSLLSEGDAHFDSLSFTEWAESLGYDTDSRKAESIYNTCLKTGRKLARFIPREKLDALREWACDY